MKKHRTWQFMTIATILFIAGVVASCEALNREQRGLQMQSQAETDAMTLYLDRIDDIRGAAKYQAKEWEGREAQ